MHWALLLGVSFAPAVLWVWYFQRQDSRDREPARLLAKAFVFGMFAVPPAAGVEYLFQGQLLASAQPLIRFLALFVAVGCVEELAKFAAFGLAVRRSGAFNEPLDGIVYAVTAALGFAAVENLLYTAAFGLQIAPARAVIASLAHASFSGIVGYAAGLAAFCARPWTAALAGLAAAAALHALYNFLIIDGTFPAWLALPLIYGVYRFLGAKIRQLRTLAPL